MPRPARVSMSSLHASPQVFVYEVGTNRPDGRASQDNALQSQELEAVLQAAKVRRSATATDLITHTQYAHSLYPHINISRIPRRPSPPRARRLSPIGWASSCRRSTACRSTSPGELTPWYVILFLHLPS